MRAGDESFERLRAALEELAAADAPDVLNEARAEARARVRSMLADALAHSMLEKVRGHLDAASSAPIAERDPPRPTHPPATEPHSPRPTQPPATEPHSPRPTQRPATEPLPPRPTQPPATEPALPPTGQAAAFDSRTSRSRDSEILAWYLYGVVRATEASQLAEVPGIDASYAITMIEEGPLAAVASEIPLAEFEETRLRQHLSDMAWVERTARAHERVLDVIRSEVTVVPMRLCTVHREPEGVRAMLRREAASLEQALAHLEGRTEWGLKVFHDPAAAEEAEPTAAGSSAAGAGTAYLEQRRRERDREQRFAERAHAACGELHERLDALAADSVVLPAQAPGPRGLPAEMIMNAAYLVDDDRELAFRDELEALSERISPLGMELELTGPWPAYNFVPGPIGAAW